ncbi:prefoldin subunit 1 [Mesocricetus auratus]|uniref:Prefoldin subunit 1 n=1 Tax=Mesocricetus auratus TaxID=10036 RepID=A0A1U7Q4D6_MESAU|nr:prefoldin subunit 1 [Mesocricetus auratus]
MAATMYLELKKAFTGCLQAKDTQQKVRLAGKQTEQLNRTKRHAYLADTDIMTLIEETDMYEDLGRMFILQSKDLTHNHLLEKQETAQENIKELEQKRSYLDGSIRVLRTTSERYGCREGTVGASDNMLPS